MTLPCIEAACFDYADTLVTLSPHARYSEAVLHDVSDLVVSHTPDRIFTREDFETVDTTLEQLVVSERGTPSPRRAATLLGIAFERAGFPLPEETVHAIYSSTQEEWGTAATILPGVEDTLSWLEDRGVALALISNALFGEAVLAQLEHTGLTRFFPVIAISSLCGFWKPDRRIFDLACGELGIPAHRTLMVGDSDADIEGALSAGMEPVRIGGSGGAGVPVIATLAELISLPYSYGPHRSRSGESDTLE